MATNPDEYAYPMGQEKGLTKREYFAAEICKGLCSNSSTMSPLRNQQVKSDTCEWAVEQADHLIIALNQTP